MSRPRVHKTRRLWCLLLALPTVLLLVMGLYLWARFGGDRPVVYADPAEHFKYGSTGGERESGFPYWIFRALPQLCADHLPGQGYASLGMIFEPGRPLPVGMSMRHHLGLERVFLNCAVCHTSTVRDSPQADPRLYLAMPANRFNVMAFEDFFFNCAKDEKFSKAHIIPQVRHLLQQQGEDLDLLERYVVYPLAVWIMRERLLMLAGRFDWAQDQHAWGPGRVDTFNVAKVLFNFPMQALAEHEQNAPADFPAIWNQAPRVGMQLHWDGNNALLAERDKSAAFGTGTTPPTLDVAAVGRVEAWLMDLDPPPYPYAINRREAERGAIIYRDYCSDCHGAGPRDFSGAAVGKVTPIAAIATDRHRLDSYSYALAVNQATLYAGYPWRFSHFRKTYGYANQPLDGIWLRAPYLHNGSVPTLWDLLQPTAQRPSVFYRGYDVYDQERVGFVSSVPGEAGRDYFRYDTSVPGNGNQGHEGEAYGTALAAEEKWALIEYLKTF